MKYKEDKEQALKDNIQIRYKGFGWTDWKTQWSHAGVKLTIPQLEKRLKDLIKTDKKNKRKPPKNPDVPVPERTDMPSLGTTTTQTSQAVAQLLLVVVTLQLQAAQVAMLRSTLVVQAKATKAKKAEMAHSLTRTTLTTLALQLAAKLQSKAAQ